MRKEQVVLLTDSQFEINSYISKGWRVISVTPQHVSNNSTYSPVRGVFCIVFEREISLTNKND